MATVFPCQAARRARSAGSVSPRFRGGFTLLELLVVMVIIGLLAGFVAPKYFDQIGKSNTQIARAQIDALGKALDATVPLDSRRRLFACTP